MVVTGRPVGVTSLKLAAMGRVVAALGAGEGGKVRLGALLIPGTLGREVEAFL